MFRVLNSRQSPETIETLTGYREMFGDLLGERLILGGHAAVGWGERAENDSCKIPDESCKTLANLYLFSSRPQ